MQQLNPSEISALIKQRIGDLDTSATAKNEGTIVMVSDGMCVFTALLMQCTVK
jgi:F-type H+-transporting ATPase subunit alpha